MKTPKYLSSRGYFSFLVGSLAVGQMSAFANTDECYYHETSGFPEVRDAIVQRPHECEEEEIEVPDGVIGLLRQLPSITINGSHHRLLLDTPVGENGWHTWLTGDFTTHDQLNADQSVFEIGASRNVEIGGQTFRVGLAYGHASVDQDFSLGGGSNIEGNFGLAEVDYQIPDSKFIVSGLLYYGEWNADVTRGYISGGLPSRSKGGTDIDTLAYRLRLDWKDAYVNDKISITPRLSYTGMDTTGDAYTESGGTAPTAFGEQDYVDHEARLGADIDYEINDSTQLRTILEIAHRFDKKGTVESGGGGGPTIDINQSDEHDTWGRLGFELSHSFDERQLVRAAVFGATKGEDATVSGAISYNLSF